MTFHPIVRWRAGLTLAWAGLVVGAATAQEPATNSLTVSATFDGRPFVCRIDGETPRAGVRMVRLTYPSPVVSALPQNNTVSARLFLPNDLQPGGAKRPAVICLPILNGDEDLTEMVCSALVGRGIPALMFRLPYYGERGPKEGRRALAADPKVFVEAIEQARADTRRAADLLAAWPGIDGRRLGITGISLGGILTASFAGADPRFHRASLLLAGGDLLQIIHHARETRQLSEMLRQLPDADRAAMEAKLKAIDPLTHAPGLRERARQGRVLMLNAGEDEVIPRACTERLADALGISRQVVWFEGLGHYTAMAELPRALRLTADFFAQDLPPGVKPPAPAAPAALTPLGRVMSVAWQAVTMLATEPATGHCHLVQVELAATNQQGRVITGAARLAVGDGGKFALWAKAPEVGEVGAGQGSFPWVQTEGQVFAGTKNPGTNTSPFAFVEPQHVLNYRVAAGAAASVVLVPDLAQRWMVVEEDSAAASGAAVRITAKDPRKLAGSIRLEFQADGRTPAGAEFDANGVKGRLRVQAWQTNTFAVGMFEPPANVARREVPQEDVQRLFGAILNYAGDRAQPRPRGNATNAPPAAPVRLEELIQSHLRKLNTEGSK